MSKYITYAGDTANNTISVVVLNKVAVLTCGAKHCTTTRALGLMLYNNIKSLETQYDSHVYGTTYAVIESLVK